MKELPGGDLLAGINMDTAGATVARLDASGNFIWCKSYMRPHGVVNDCVIESDSSFIVTGVTDSAAVENQRLFVMKLNGAGNVQWCRGYDDLQHWDATAPSRIVKTNDASYVVLATSGSQPVLMKTDMNGDTVWTRSLGAPGYAYSTANLLACSDGGYLFDGVILGELPDMNSGLYYFFKTDANGHLPCSELGVSVHVSELFPVDSTFTITAVGDATAFQTSLSNATFDPITTYDACVVATQVPAPARQGRVFGVHPNPTSGHFTVSFPDPLTAESYYAVYDTSGRLLYQRPLPKGQLTEEVDLSRFGKGTYLLKVTATEGVCYERVVVE